MKKATSRRQPDPSLASLEALPEVNFQDFTVHRNRHAARIAAEGSTLRHDGPSRASLAEIPEVDLRSAKRRRNPFAKRIDASALAMHTRRGRPALGDETGPTVTRSVRLPVALAKALEVLARGEGITTHALMRQTLASRVRAELAIYHRPSVAREGRPADRPAALSRAAATAGPRPRRPRRRRGSARTGPRSSPGSR
jgi:hypothetical protein